MRRNTKTMYEWRKAYRDKEELMLERGFPEVSPHEFYRDLFPEGSLQSAEHDGKGNLIATQIRPSGKGRTKQWVKGGKPPAPPKSPLFVFRLPSHSFWVVVVPERALL